MYTKWCTSVVAVIAGALLVTCLSFRSQYAAVGSSREASSDATGACRRSIVALDELGRGTATMDGVAIAAAVLEHATATVGCRGVFATHYHVLADDYADDKCVGVKHMACKVEADHDSTVPKVMFPCVSHDIQLRDMFSQSPSCLAHIAVNRTHSSAGLAAWHIFEREAIHICKHAPPAKPKAIVALLHDLVSLILSCR